VADIAVSNPVTPPNGVLILNQPGQRLYAPSGRGVVKGAVYITKDADGAHIDASIKIELPAGFRAQAGAVQCAASQCRINCEIDIGGNPLQGVQIIQWGGPIPDSTDITGLYAYNNTQTPGDPDKNHGIYVQDSTGLKGDNIRFADIKGGWGIHFYCNQKVQVSKGARLSHVTCERNLGDVIFWGPGVTDNHVTRLLSLDVGKWGPLHQNASGEAGGNTLDYVTEPAADYGYQPPQTETTPPPDDMEAQLQAWNDWHAQAPTS
jgi:hypothetical protein